MIHDAKPALLAFAAHGWELAGVARDTALAAYLARPDQRTYDLTDLALRYLQRELRVDAPDDGQLTLDGLGDEGAAEQNLMLRARATLDLADAHRPRSCPATTAPRSGCWPRWSSRWSRCSAEMERVGIAADTDYLSELEAHFAAEVKAAAQAAHEVVGREFNLGSPKQLQEILFTELRPAQDQADQDRLHHRRRRAAEPVRADRRTRCWSTCCATATWPSSSPPWTACSSRSPTTAASTPRSTRRWPPPAGCRRTDPNLQNIPIRTEEGRRIRRAFVVGDGLRAAC